MKQADEIRSRMVTIEADIKALEEINPEEQTEENHLRLDALLEDWDAAKTELEPWEAREAKIAEMRERSHQQANREVTGADPTVIVKQKRDPFADLDSVRTHMVPVAEVRARAEAAIEQFANRQDHWALTDDAAQHVTDLIYKRGKNFGKALSEQLLVDVAAVLLLVCLNLILVATLEIDAADVCPVDRCDYIRG